MSESTKYTIVVRGQRIEGSKAVYHTYHKVREAERYQNKLIRQFERSLEYFQEKGVNVEYLVNRCQSTIEDKLIEQEQLLKLQVALDTLSEDERLLIYELFFGLTPLFWTISN